ncbi:hypothetical protein YFHUAIHA_CDS0130 [Phage C48C1]|nr:hypothetical protein YFHUAIHA_CDS0130 [Phage C48C1]
MPTSLEIDIPYNGGNVGGITETGLVQNNGNHYVWVGGNNDKKFISVRLQANPNFFFVDVFQLNNLRVETPESTTLSTVAIAESGSSNQYTSYMRLCRINSNTAYLKLFTGEPSAGRSRHYVIEFDESDGNKVSMYDVTNSMDDQQRGGLFNYASNTPVYQGRGLYQTFMQQLKENKIVTYESTHSNVNFYSFVERTWDPVAKTLESKTVTTGKYTDSHIRDREVYPFNQLNVQYLSITNENEFTVETTANYPNLHGSKQDYTAEAGGYIRWINSVTGRDGKMHFSLSQPHGNTNFQDEAFYLPNSKYVVTFDPSTDEWTLTSRYDNLSNISNGRDQFGVWLPLNTVNAKNYHNSLLGDTSSEIDETLLHAKTWISIGASHIKVVGAEPGSELPISTESNSSSDDALQAMWLDEDHFMVIWGTYVQNSWTTGHSNVRYTIIRYYDEQYVEVVSEGLINNNFYPSYMQSSTIFQPIDEYTWVSNVFSRVATIWAPEE